MVWLTHLTVELLCSGCGCQSAHRVPGPCRADEIAKVSLYSGRLGRFQTVHCSGRASSERVSGAPHGYHVVVPLAGTFVWNRGIGEPIFANSNSVAHVESNDDYTVSHLEGEEVSAVFWPRRSILAELVGAAGDGMPPVTLCTAAIQIELRRLVSLLRQSGGELEFEECDLSVLQKMHAPIDKTRAISQKSMRVVRCAKEYLHAHFDEQLSLPQVAEAVGVSAVYLTQLFRASEGVPLYRYHLDLRLNKALDRLPRCDDITNLALDLGFSSHAHSSTEFSLRSGIAPSSLRDDMRL